MSIRHALIGQVLLVRWHEECVLADVERLKQVVERAHAEVGERLVYLAVIPVDHPPPDGPTRVGLRDGTTYCSRFCRSMHLVIEGKGIRQALIRSVVAGLLLAVLQRGHNFRVHRTVEEALDTAPLDQGVDPTAVLEEARRHGLLTEAG